MPKENKLTDICRICLHTDETYNSKSLFEVYECLEIHEHVTRITQVSINRDDGLPDKICTPCFLDLKTCINFKNKCETSTNILYKGIIESSNLNNVFEITIKKEDQDELDSEELYTDIVETEFLNVPELKCDDDYSQILNNAPECHDCGEVFKSKCKLRVHWKKVHRPKSFVCPICRRLFKSENTYNKHMKNAQGPCSELAGGIGIRVEGEGKSRIFFCPDCDYKSHKMLHMRTHLVTHSGKKLFKCHICDRAYTQRGSLISHQESVHNEGIHTTECHICGKTFHGRRRLYKHIRTHTEESEQCKVCMKFMKGKKSLQVHMLRHSGVKSYTCEQCAASFYTSAELCNHKRIHAAKLKAYGCDLCEYRANTKYLVTKHMRFHVSGEKPYSCKVCGNFFVTLQKLNAHERLHFEARKYSCPLCPKTFFCRRSVSKHVIGKHNSKMYLNKNTVSIESNNHLLSDKKIENDIRGTILVEKKGQSNKRL